MLEGVTVLPSEKVTDELIVDGNDIGLSLAWCVITTLSSGILKFMPFRMCHLVKCAFHSYILIDNVSCYF
jgi:hypothetical protein